MSKALPWRIVRRRAAFVGEARANVVRLVAILCFYGVELINRHGLRLGFLEIPKLEAIDDRFHVAVTALAAAWTLVALAVGLCLRQRFFPEGLKYASTGADLALLTALLLIADGPGSPLVVCFFLVVSVSATRQSLALVRVATAGAIAGYLVLCGHARWFTERDIGVARYEQLITVLALLLSGVILGQVVRSFRAVAEEYAERSASAESRS